MILKINRFGLLEGKKRCDLKKQGVGGGGEGVEVLSSGSGKKGALRELGGDAWVSPGQHSSVRDSASKGTFCNFWTQFWLLHFGWGVLGHLGHRGQGRCQMSSQNSLHNKGLCGPRCQWCLLLRKPCSKGPGIFKASFS